MVEQYFSIKIDQILPFFPQNVHTANILSNPMTQCILYVLYSRCRKHFDKTNPL